MMRVVLKSSILTLVLLGSASTAVAHHPPRFERCQRFTFTGQLERIEWVNPHVLLFIKTDDGTSQQVGWLSPRVLKRAGIETDTLRVGDRLVIEGGTRIKDIAEEPILLSIIRRPSDGWEWSQPLQGC
jgi:hypothetical protein